MAKILITGGAGFIGSHVADQLIDKQHDVTILDDLSTGKKENINEKAFLVQKDIRDKDIISLFEKERFDYIIHHAAQINVRKSTQDPIFDAELNIIGTLNILEASRKTGVKKVIYASSGGACYGEPKEDPATEKHSVNPLCHYGISKHTVEHYLFLYKELYNLDYEILRYANVYGPRQDPLGEAGVIAIFTNKIKNNETPVIFGDGEQTRDFVYVKDVAQANILALEKSTKSKIFNIGTGIHTSVNQLTGLILKELGSDIKPEHGPEVAGEVRHIALDISKAKEEFGWEPEISFEEGIKKTIEWSNS